MRSLGNGLMPCACAFEFRASRGPTVHYPDFRVLFGSRVIRPERQFGGNLLQSTHASSTAANRLRFNLHVFRSFVCGAVLVRRWLSLCEKPSSQHARHFSCVYGLGLVRVRDRFVGSAEVNEVANGRTAVGRCYYGYGAGLDSILDLSGVRPFPL